MSVSPFTNTHRDSGHSCRQMQVLRWVSAHSQTLTGTVVTAAYRCRCWDECRPIHKHTQGQGSQLQTDAGVEMSVSLITTTHGGSYKGRQMQVLRWLSAHSHTQGQGSQLQTDAGAEVSVSLITTSHGGSCKGRQMQVLRWVSGPFTYTRGDNHNGRNMQVLRGVSPFTDTHRDWGHSGRQTQVLRWVFLVCLFFHTQ